jgi:YD repeat-containing protein
MKIFYLFQYASVRQTGIAGKRLQLALFLLLFLAYPFLEAAAAIPKNIIFRAYYSPILWPGPPEACTSYEGTSSDGSYYVYHSHGPRDSGGNYICYFWHIHPNNPSLDGKVQHLSVYEQLTCPQGFTLTNDGTCQNPKDNGPPPCTLGTRNPINSGNGVKYQQEIDLASYSTNAFSRFYNSRGTYTASRLSFGWTHTFSRSVQSISNTSVIINRSSGEAIDFSKTGFDWTTDADITDQLEELKDSGGARIGWHYKVDATGEIETYDASGKLLAIQDRAGLMQVMTYSDSSTPSSVASKPGLLIAVTDSLGRQISFSYDVFSRIKTMTDLAGSIYTYTYSSDSYKNLISVTYPDSTTRAYHYENTSFRNALTGVTDQNGNRYATWSYDSKGRAISSEHAGGVEKSTLLYNPTSTVVTDTGTGAVRTYNLTTILGVVKSTGQSQPGGSGCAASASSLTYDANGNIASRTDFNGNKTIYSYDLSRNLETLRTEGLTTAGATTPESRTIASTWHPTWQLPTLVEEYSGAAATGTPVKRTSYTYDDRANLTAKTESDPVNNISRTTTITYSYSNEVPGLVLNKTVDGPRTDVSDITTYAYYSHDEICTDSASPSSLPNFGCRGQLQSAINAFGHVTQYSRYNHHGQLEESIDPNGLVTTQIYDLRQRLTSKTIGNEITVFERDEAGQMTKMTLPDGSSLNYVYDAAHRLTGITDILGNRISYTLDSEGNRISEQIFDPDNNLSKSISRSYDALNRLQTLTGIEN